MGQSVELNEFVPWTKIAPKGSSIVYHRGDLASDAHDCGDGSPSSVMRQRAAASVRKAAWEAYEAGDVSLVQRAIPERGGGLRSFEYIAVKR